MFVRGRRREVVPSVELHALPGLGADQVRAEVSQCACVVCVLCGVWCVLCVCVCVCVCVLRVCMCVCCMS